MSAPPMVVERGAARRGGGYRKPAGSRTSFEVLSWFFMRISGLALIFLALYHLIWWNLVIGVADQVDLSGVRAPTLALLAEDDARVNVTIPYADSSYRRAGVAFEQVTYPGAGHGFLRAQDSREGANLAASQAGWSRTIAWLRRHLEQ